MSALQLKFRWMRVRRGDENLIPNGYRLATVEEVRNHSDSIARLGIPPLPPIQHFSIYAGAEMHLLDGYMTYPSNHHFELHEGFRACGCTTVVKEREWDEDAQEWRTKSSACFSSDGRLLRKQLYLHISLSPQAKQCALQNACSCADMEALWWLLTTASSSEELEGFKLSFNEHWGASVDDYQRMLLCLVSSTFQFQQLDSDGHTAIQLPLQLELDSDGHTAIDYFINLVTDDYWREDKKFYLYFVELLVELFSPEIVHWKNSKGMSFLDMVQGGGGTLIQIFTKLLSVSQQPFESHLANIKPRFKAVLLEAVEIGYAPLVEKLLEFKTEVPDSREIRLDDDEKTLFHYAVESDNPDVFGLLVNKFRPEAEVLRDLKDFKGRTLLHMAASKGNKNAFDMLLALLGDDNDVVAKYLKETDRFGRTALQMACLGGHRDMVKVLVEKGKWDPLKERDDDGYTALHYAAQGKYPEVAAAICKQLLESCSTRSERSFLLWASAGGVGTADEGENVHPSVKTFLESEKASDKTHLLREAAIQNNVEMAWELLNRGADIDDLRDPEWYRGGFNEPVENVLHQLDLLKEQGRDQPSIEDKLGRNVFAEGLAALFLNRFIESPIAVGICGEWGMGKSSLMIQTENILLLTAAQLTFPNLLRFENFVGAKKISLSTKGRRIYQTIKRGACSLFVQEEDRSEEILLFKLYHKFKKLVKIFWPSVRHRSDGGDPLVNILQEYQPKYHAIYKSLACMDNYQMLDSPKRTNFSQQEHALRQVPRILTIRYNAWHYRDQSEAWAGLAVTITKEIENSMTRAQWFSTCWRYTWKKNSVNIIFQVFLPCFLATFLAGWIAWAVWILLKEAKFKDLKYGSIPITIIAIVWIVLKSLMSVVKPVSVQMLGYITSPDHTNRLGYQEQVISDIMFLKNELGRRAHWFFYLVSGEWCWNWFGLCVDNVENSSIRKFRPASENQLRIITFVDDLDRCEEKVILQVLSAANLVLARCEINVVMGIDKKMIEKAIRRSFEDDEDIDLAEKFLCKIIQIPLSLPDPTEDDTNKFLEHHLGHKLQHEISSKDDDTDYGTTDDDVDVEDQNHSARNEDNTVEHCCHIDFCNPSQTRCPGIIKRAADWLIYLFRCSYSIACNISSELQHMTEQLDDQKLRPLAFSKGARLTREMLITNYSKEEADTMGKLKGFATGNRKHPREWKRLLSYHKLAWNILSKRGDVRSLPKWKVELVGWIFLCYQWKREMNTLIKGWSKFASMDDQSEVGNARARRGPSLSGPPLSQIVKNCVDDMENSEKGEEAAKKGGGFMELRGRLRREKEVSLYIQGHAEEGTFHNSWKQLQKALEIQDVSMKGIQLFQQFRLHCETDHLPWPLNDKLS